MRNNMDEKGYRDQGVYDLIAVICHEGGANAGNYWTLGKRSDDVWFSFSYKGIQRIQPSEVVNEHAYILIYDLQY